jgi:adenylate kinase
MSAMSRAIRAFGGGAAARRNLSVATSKEAPALAAAVVAGRKAGRRDPGEDGSRVQWVFLGCPGVGKGTYAGRLSRLLGVPHVATGDLVRDALASQDPLSKQVLLASASISMWVSSIVL